MATWPGPWKAAAKRRSTRRTTVRSDQLDFLGAASGAVDLTKPAPRKALVLATRLVRWMADQQGHAATVNAIAKGIHRVSAQINKGSSGSDKRWTVTLNKAVQKRSKPAQLLDHKGRGLLDRSHLHSLFADVAGAAEGGLGFRAQLAQVGENIDRLYDSMLQIQKELHVNFDLTPKDARRGLSFQICSIIISAFASKEVPHAVARELFDEFAGVPSSHEATLCSVGVGANIARFEEAFRGESNAAHTSYAKTREQERRG